MTEAKVYNEKSESERKLEEKKQMPEFSKPMPQVVLTPSVLAAGSYVPVAVTKLIPGHLVNPFWLPPADGETTDTIINKAFSINPDYRQKKYFYSEDPATDLMATEKIKVGPMKLFCECMESCCCCSSDSCYVRPGLMVYIDLPDQNKKILYEYEVNRCLCGYCIPCPGEKRFVGIAKTGENQYIKTPVLYLDQCNCCNLLFACFPCCCKNVLDHVNFYIPVASGSPLVGYVALIKSCCLCCAKYYYEIVIEGLPVYQLEWDRSYFCCDKVKQTADCKMCMPYGFAPLMIKKNGEYCGEIKGVEWSHGVCSCMSFRRIMEVTFPKEANIIERYALMVAGSFILKMNNQAKSY